MKNLDKLTAPGERIIYSCKKEWVGFIVLFFFGFIFTLPLTFVAISKRVPLEVRIIILTLAIIYVFIVILGAREYRRSYLLLTNRRVMLRRGIFRGKTYVIPLESIQALEPVHGIEFSAFYIHTTDGKKIDLLYPFYFGDLEQWARYVNESKGETVYVETEKRKPSVLQQIVVFLVIIFLAGLLYFYIQSLT